MQPNIITVGKSKDEESKKKAWGDILLPEEIVQVQAIRKLFRPGSLPMQETAGNEAYTDIDKGTERYVNGIYRTAVDENVEVVTDGALGSETSYDEQRRPQRLIQVKNYTYVILRYKRDGIIFKETYHLKDFLKSEYLRSLLNAI